MAITFNCAACGKSLTTTDDKAGRKAKCPGCGEVVTVPGPPVDDELDDAGERDEANDDEFGNLPARPAPTRDSGSKTCPMCGAENSRRSKTCTACGEKFEEAEDEQSGQRQPRIIDPGEVISASWKIYTNELGLVLGSVIVTGLVTMAAAIPAIVIAIIAIIQMEQGQDPSMLFGVAIGLTILLYILFFWYMQIGISIVLFKAARGKATTIGEIFTGGPYFLRMLGSTFIFLILTQIGDNLCVIPGIILRLMFWPYAYILIDENPSGLDCLWRAKDITQGNWGAVFIIFLATLAINLLGLLALGIGLIFTIPLTQLIFAVAYCHMTGQRTAE